MTRLTALIVPTLALAAAVAAQTDPTDEAVQKEMKRQNVPGLSLAVVRDGTIIKAAGYGFADIQGRVPATAETVYHIGSISKQFVAAGILLLAQEKRLGLDDPVQKHLRDVPSAWNAITIRHLLTHTAGITRDLPGFDDQKDQPNAQVLRTVFPLPLRFSPGEKWEYSNSGYAALAEIIGTVTGRPWEEYVRARIFTPLGMTATRPTNTTESIAQRARPYTDNNKLLPVEPWRALHPAGGFLSTVLDLAKWDAALYGDTILTAASRQQMWTPVTLKDGTSQPYGLGWELNSPLRNYGPIGTRKVVSHGGSLKGFRAQYARFVDDRVSVILLMNQDDVDWQATLYVVASRHLPAMAEPPAR